MRVMRTPTSSSDSSTPTDALDPALDPAFDPAFDPALDPVSRDRDLAPLAAALLFGVLALDFAAAGGGEATGATLTVGGLGLEVVV